MSERKVNGKREPHQKKQAVPGRQSRRDQPELYTEKKRRANFVITPFAKNSLNEWAKECNLSMSEYLERLLCWLADPTAQESFAHAHKFIVEADPLKGKKEGKNKP